MFSIVNGVLFRPLPYTHSEEIVALWDVGKDGLTMPASWPDFNGHVTDSMILNGPSPA
jgi:hypothetical protein